jgi:coenzyme F420 hydrogenase subunit beta
MAKEKRPKLNAKLGLVLTFFCAGTPNTNGTLDLFRKMDVKTEEVKQLRYRGNGWPGLFKAQYSYEKKSKSIKYIESWLELQKYRPFRCHLCPDGLGQVADIACGDAWHRYRDDCNPGQSIVLIRTQKGKEILRGAMDKNYINLTRIDKSLVIEAQGLIKRKPEIFGRLLAMKLLFVPTPKFIAFALFKSWLKLGWWRKIETILGTLKRLIQRRLWQRNPLK